MTSLVTFPKASPVDELLEVFRRDGACIIKDVLSAEEVKQTLEQVMPYVERTRYGADEFTGKRTRRTGALVARSESCREIVTNELILETAEKFLADFTKRIILHLTQTICIGPGGGAQTLHRDRLAWGEHLPKSIEPQFNTMWALTDFTTENGATRVVPGSNHWDWEKRADREQICQAEMSAGSVLLYSGSVIHSGGENKSEQIRMGLNITYCLGWLRQEENQYLSCPPEYAKKLSPTLQELLGYTMGNYALGYYSDPDGLGERSAGILQPETVLGVRSRSKMDSGIVEELAS
ncbi:MAG: phytanoyl-CoA dioxygenase family protein [Pseudomonadales bacterium]|jgi:ectoine hydroxylase-related dioxygenase (phytanoyl-CoA dioxygenase family)